MFYDFEGRPIGVDRWGELFEDFPGRLVAETKVGETTVVTCWIGHPIDDNFTRQPPNIYGTVVFVGHSMREEHPSTDWDSARAMHQQVVDRLRSESS